MTTVVASEYIEKERPIGMRDTYIYGWTDANLTCKVARAAGKEQLIADLPCAKNSNRIWGSSDVLKWHRGPCR